MLTKLRKIDKTNELEHLKWERKKKGVLGRVDLMWDVACRV